MYTSRASADSTKLLICINQANWVNGAGNAFLSANYYYRRKQMDVFQCQQWMKVHFPVLSPCFPGHSCLFSLRHQPCFLSDPLIPFSFGQYFPPRAHPFSFLCVCICVCARGRVGVRTCKSGRVHAAVVKAHVVSSLSGLRLEIRSAVDFCAGEPKIKAVLKILEWWRLNDCKMQKRKTR